MIVVDIETSGSNPQKHSIVSIGAVDTESPHEPTGQFYVECRMWDGAHIDPEALAVNGFSEEEIRDSKKKTEGEAIAEFLSWFESRGSHLFAGHIPTFDIGFLQAATFRAHLNFPLAHRTIDQHTCAYMHMVTQGIQPPMQHKKSDINSDTIMKYVGIPAEPRPHNALHGAIWEAEALSRLIFGKNLLPQFKKYPIPWQVRI